MRLHDPLARRRRYLANRNHELQLAKAWRVRHPGAERAARQRRRRLTLPV